ncbi:MAG TPA: alanyl-tRNA editing protein [Candidatus Nanoarchaeia archaeon]|nr:alanyl-tRNA editing protein [Candidatus Nanoarchaeia archaeon]
MQIIDSYLTKLETTVKEAGADFVILKNSIIHQKGGGQPIDIGFINGFKVVDVIDGKHFLKDNNLKAGDKVTVTIDWPNRYYLMKAHTGEHLFYQCLNRVKSVSVDKINLTDDECSLFVSGDVSFDDLLKAQLMCNDLISKGMAVTSSFADDLSGVRIKSERVRGEVIVVRIGDFDASACTGTHVKDISEIGFFLVTGFNSVGGNSYRIDFKVGSKAASNAVVNSTNLLGICYSLKLVPDTFIKSVTNAFAERLELTRAVRKLSESVISLSDFSGSRIVKNFSGVSNDLLIKKAGELSGVVVFLNDDTLIVKGNDNLFNRLLLELGGKGGGKPGLKIGRVSNPDFTRISF